MVKSYHDHGKKKDKDDKSAWGRSKFKSKIVKCYKCQTMGISSETAQNRIRGRKSPLHLST